MNREQAIRAHFANKVYVFKRGGKFACFRRREPDKNKKTRAWRVEATPHLFSANKYSSREKAYEALQKLPGYIVKDLEGYVLEKVEYLNIGSMMMEDRYKAHYAYVKQTEKEIERLEKEPYHEIPPL